jgi:hypothetical protein
MAQGEAEPYQGAVSELCLWTGCIALLHYSLAAVFVYYPIVFCCTVEPEVRKVVRQNLV